MAWPLRAINPIDLKLWYGNQFWINFYMYFMGMFWFRFPHVWLISNDSALRNLSDRRLPAWMLHNQKNTFNGNNNWIFIAPATPCYFHTYHWLGPLFIIPFHVPIISIHFHPDKANSFHQSEIWNSVSGNDLKFIQMSERQSKTKKIIFILVTGY